MKMFEDFRSWISENWDIYHKEKLNSIEIPIIKNAPDYYNFKEQVKEVILHTEEKKKEEKEFRKNLTINAKGI